MTLETRKILDRCTVAIENLNRANERTEIDAFSEYCAATDALDEALPNLWKVETERRIILFRTLAGVRLWMLIHGMRSAWTWKNSCESMIITLWPWKAVVME